MKPATTAHTPHLRMWMQISSITAFLPVCAVGVPSHVCACVPVCERGCCWLKQLQISPESELQCLLNIICGCCKSNKRDPTPLQMNEPRSLVITGYCSNQAGFERGGALSFGQLIKITHKRGSPSSWVY